MPKVGHKSHAPRVIYCAECDEHHLHEVQIAKESTGKITRSLTCPVCQARTNLGIACPKCGECRMRVVTTRHRGGVTIRERECRSCRHSIRTREIIESFAS